MRRLGRGGRASVVIVALGLILAGCPDPVGGPGNGGGTDPTPAAIALDPTGFGVRIGEEAVVTATVTGEGVTAAVDWSVSDESVVSIVSSTETTVTVRAEAAGIAEVTATLRSDTTVTQSASVTAYLVSVLLGDPADEPYHVPEDGTFDLSDLVDVLPTAFADQAVTWASADESIVTVSASGIATGEALGTTSITATSVEDPTRSDSVQVEVVPGVTTVELRSGGNPAGASTGLVVGDTLQLDTAVAPAGRPAGVTWASDDETVATVTTDGLVTAQAEGSAVITATSTYNTSASDSITVTVAGRTALDGLVLSSVAGSALGATTVTIVNAGDPAETATTTTESDGTFSFSDVYPGIYTVSLEKSGYAGSRVVGVNLTADATVTLVQHEVAFADRSTTPPELTVGGITEGGVHDAAVTITLTASGANADTPVIGSPNRPSLMLNVGGEATLLTALATGGSDTLSYVWDAADWPAGEVTVEAVAYDSNNNRTVVRVPVEADGGTLSAPTLPPIGIEVIGVTYGEDQRLYSVRESRPLSPSTGTSSWVEATVERRLSSYDGARMYRATSSGGPWTLVDQTATVSSGEFRLVDTDPGLFQGSTYYYEFAFFDEDGEGPRSAAIDVTLLPAYDLRLVAPADDASITDATPTLTWEVTGVTMPAGATRTDTVFVTRPTEPSVVVAASVSDGVSYTVSGALGSGVLYEWNVASVTRLNGGTSSGYSLSFPTTLSFSSYLGGAASFASNGGFQFTVE